MRDLKKVYDEVRKEFPKDGDTVRCYDVLGNEDYSVDDMSSYDEFLEDYVDENEKKINSMSNEELKKMIRNYLNNSIYVFEDYGDEGINIGIMSNWEVVK